MIDTIIKELKPIVRQTTYRLLSETFSKLKLLGLKKYLVLGMVYGLSLLEGFYENYNYTKLGSIRLNLPDKKALF